MKPRFEPRLGGDAITRIIEPLYFTTVAGIARLIRESLKNPSK